MKNFADFRTSVLCSLQWALRDLVSPTLRAVTVRIEYPLIVGRLLFESTGDEEFELASLTTTYVLADFPPEVQVDFKQIAVAPGDELFLEPGEEWVFRRREGESLVHPIVGCSELTANTRVVNWRVGTGIPISRIPRDESGFAERVNFGTTIGNYLDRRDKTHVPTSVGVLVLRSGGSTLVFPARPMTVPLQLNDFRQEVVLAVQRALWDLVTPMLRGMTVRFDYPIIHGRLLFEAVGDDEREIVALISASVAADLGTSVDVDFCAVALPVWKDRRCEPGEEWAYLRCEEDVLNPPDHTSQTPDALSAIDSFNAMSDFVWRSAERDGHDMTSFLEWTRPGPFGSPVDLTVWEPWTQSLERVRHGKVPRSE